MPVQPSYGGTALQRISISVPEFIDAVFAKTSPKRSFSVIQNERFGLVFAKTGSIISGTGAFCQVKRIFKEGLGQGT
jgi:hypothetical protein